jgi:hypothetical protein
MAHKWARIWAAHSPQTDVPQNTYESLASLLHLLERPGEPMTYDLARSAGVKVAGAKVANVNRAYAGEELSGDKVEAMADYLLGKPRGPMDTHIIKAAGVNKGSPKWSSERPHLRTIMTRAEGLPRKGSATVKSLTDREIYDRFDASLRRTMESFDPNRTYNEIFGNTWSGSRVNSGKKHELGPIDILRKKGLLQEARMLDPMVLREVLKSNGWSALAIGGLMAALGSEDGAQ